MQEAERFSIAKESEDGLTLCVGDAIVIRSGLRDPDTQEELQDGMIEGPVEVWCEYAWVGPWPMALGWNGAD